MILHFALWYKVNGGGRGGSGATPLKFRWGFAARSLKPLPFFRPKYVIFHTLFQTWLKLRYPISDQILPCFFWWNTFKFPTIIKSHLSEEEN